MWNLLFIEDEPVLRLTCVEAAKACGHAARAAPNAHDALQMFREQKPDAILTDVLMPGMDGIELVGIMRRSDPNLLIVVLTGLATEDSRQRALRAGATRFLVKPVSAFDLISLLERTLGQP